MGWYLRLCSQVLDYLSFSFIVILEVKDSTVGGKSAIRSYQVSVLKKYLMVENYFYFV